MHRRQNPRQQAHVFVVGAGRVCIAEQAAELLLCLSRPREDALGCGELAIQTGVAHAHDVHLRADTAQQSVLLRPRPQYLSTHIMQNLAQRSSRFGRTSFLVAIKSVRANSSSPV